MLLHRLLPVVLKVFLRLEFVALVKKKTPLELARSDVFQHACRTPLTTLQCSLDALDSKALTKTTANNGFQTYLQTAKQAAAHLVALIKSLDTNSHQTSFRPARVVQEVVNLVESQAAREVSLHPIIAFDFQLKLKGDPLYFGEALRCIIQNAIEAYDLQDLHKPVVVMGRCVAEHLIIEVIDGGQGMTSLATKLAFWKGLSYKKQGQGLGLAFVDNTIRIMFGGELTVSSQFGVGTRVVWRLPLVNGESSLTNSQNGGSSQNRERF